MEPYDGCKTSCCFFSSFLCCLCCFTKECGWENMDERFVRRKAPPPMPQELLDLLQRKKKMDEIDRFNDMNDPFLPMSYLSTKNPGETPEASVGRSSCSCSFTSTEFNGLTCFANFFSYHLLRQRFALRIWPGTIQVSRSR